MNDQNNINRGSMMPGSLDANQLQAKPAEIGPNAARNAMAT